MIKRETRLIPSTQFKKKTNGTKPVRYLACLDRGDRALAYTYRNKCVLEESKISHSNLFFVFIIFILRLHLKTTWWAKYNISTRFFLCVILGKGSNNYCNCMLIIKKDCQICLHIRRTRRKLRR